MFVLNQEYRRRDLHSRFGGQEQGGISTPANYPVIFLFTSESGEQYGYTDHWTNERIFEYTGEGQAGNMMFVQGNKAIRDHIKNSEDLHLFASVRKAYVRYLGQMVCIGYQEQPGFDQNGNPRQVIIFELTPLSEFTADDPTSVGGLAALQTEQLTLEELRKLALEDAMSRPTPLERKVAAWRRSQWIKAYVLRRAGGRCEGCGAPAPFLTIAHQPYLEVHHIDRLSDGGPDGPDAVVAVCPNCHRRAHYAQDMAEFKAQLKQVIATLERRKHYRTDL